jgi:uncharacterized membrane protein (UPF0127 family)
MKLSLKFFTAGLRAWLFLNAAQAQSEAQPPLPTVQLNAGLYVIKAEVAQTFSQQSMGLMHREKMGANDGMLFIWGESSKRCMWMRNTLLPLSVAFIDDKGVVLNVEDMKPQTEDSHCSKGDAKYALEMNLGWFKAKRLQPGIKINGIPGIGSTPK